MRIATEFSARWTICWATTYTFEPAFFESFLLKRLGDPPLNAVVVADFGKLTELWSRLAPRGSRLRTTNRRYLVRGAAIPGAAFHPKTLLLANRERGSLFVGSGNLGLSGAEQGHELFVRFDSQKASDLPAFKGWRAWMSDVVTLVDDPALRARFADLGARASWLVGAPSSASFVTNWRRPLIDSLFADDTKWTELHVTAPFFDADLRALRALIARAAPTRVALYLGKDASVDGRKLVDVLKQAAVKAKTYVFEPSAFVHAKLVVVIRGKRARVLSGSPNLSGPALLGAVTGGDANAEAGVISEMAADNALALLTPPGLEAATLDENALGKFRMARVEKGSAPAIRLRSAVQASDSFVTVAADQAAAGLSLTDGTASVPLRGKRTSRPFPIDEGAVLVWLCDEAGGVASNRVPLDDQVSLDQSLRESHKADDRPPDLDALDVQHPMGRLLAELHQTALFEIDASPAARRVAELVEANPEDTSDFWDRYLQEQLAQDPRAPNYSAHGTTPEPMSDELSRLLEQMLHQVPRPGHLRLLSGDEITRAEVEQEGKKWTPSHRLAVRAFNVLQRWSLAVADPRIRWLSEQAPLRHYVALLGAFVRIWQQRDWLPEHRLAALASTLFGAFIRTERTSGYLEALSDTERSRVLSDLKHGAAPQHAAALAFLALRHATPDEFFEWQAFLTRGTALGIFAPGDETSALIASMSDIKPTTAQIRDRLSIIANYMDDEHWCRRQSTELGLEVKLVDLGNPNYPLEVELEDGLDLLNDPRIVVLARDALAYERAPGVRLRAGEDLLAVAPNSAVFGAVHGIEVESRDVITEFTLDNMVRDGVAFGDVLRTYAVTRSTARAPRAAIRADRTST